MQFLHHKAGTSRYARMALPCACALWLVGPLSCAKCACARACLLKKLAYLCRLIDVSVSARPAKKTNLNNPEKSGIMKMRENAWSGRSLSRTVISRGDSDIEESLPLLHDSSNPEVSSEPCVSMQIMRVIIFPPRECGLPLVFWLLGWLLLLAWAAEAKEFFAVIESASRLG